MSARSLTASDRSPSGSAASAGPVLGRRALLAGALAALPLLLAGGTARAGGPYRPPQNHFRLQPFAIPVPARGPFGLATVELDIVLKADTWRDYARSQQPRLQGLLLAENWNLAVGSDGKVGAETALVLKERATDIARDVLGDIVTEVLIVSLVVT